MSAHLDHDAPLRHLVAHVLHPGTDLADRVRKLRWKRRKPRQAAQPVDEAQPSDTSPTVPEGVA